MNTGWCRSSQLHCALPTEVGDFEEVCIAAGDGASVIFRIRRTAEIIHETHTPRAFALTSGSRNTRFNIPITYRTYLASKTATDSFGKTARSFHAPGVNRKRKAETVSRKLLPVILNSKEEIGWKVQPQSSNLRQEIV